MPSSIHNRTNADPDATIQAVSDPRVTLTSHSNFSKDSLIQSLNSNTNTSNHSYLESGDFFPDANSNINDIFRSMEGKDGHEDSSILGDDMSLSVATSADFSFCTQNTNAYHYPAQYNPQPLNKDLLDEPPTKLRTAQYNPQPLNKDLLDEPPTKLRTEDNPLRDANGTKGQVEQAEKNSQNNALKKKKRSTNNTNKQVPERMFSGVASGVGSVFNAAMCSVNSCLVPTNNSDKSENYFSACYRPYLDSMSEGDESASDNGIRGAKNGNGRNNSMYYTSRT